MAHHLQTPFHPTHVLSWSAPGFPVMSWLVILKHTDIGSNQWIALTQEDIENDRPGDWMYTHSDRDRDRGWRWQGFIGIGGIGGTVECKRLSLTASPAPSVSSTSLQHDQPVESHQESTETSSS